MCAEALIERPSRWDAPFGSDMSDEDVDRALALPLLAAVDQSEFPASRSLRDIIKFDARVVEYRRGDIVVREGDYGHSVFFPLSGCLRVLIEAPRETLSAEPVLAAGETRASRRGFWRAFSQAWANNRYPEVRNSKRLSKVQLSLRDVAPGSEQEARTFVKDVDGILAACETVRIGVDDNEMVGEIAALTRSVRTATILAEEDSVLLELRWQGLRDIRKRDDTTRAFIDERFRQRAMLRQLRELDLFKGLSSDVLEQVSAQTLYESFGDFEWNRTFQKADIRDADAVIEKEPVVAEQGHYPDGLIIISSGFGRISETLDERDRTIDYVSRNGVFGWEEIVENWRTGVHVPYRKSLRAIGYVDILRIPTALVEEHVLPNLPESMLPEITLDQDDPWEGTAPASGLEQSLIDFFIDNRTINGTKTMLIDTNRCVNCDDCVRACAAAHNNNPRFVRHGPVEDHYMVANACMHCVDPVCLIGCPTGAIQRHQSTGNIIINDLTCIGCGTCANSCPYDNIRLVGIRDRKGNFVLDSATQMPIQKATKCDFCQDQLVAPACQRACPHDALIRIDMSDRKALIEWLRR